MPGETFGSSLTDRELLREVATVVSYLAAQLERLDVVLQRRFPPEEPGPRLTSIEGGRDAS